MESSSSVPFIGASTDTALPDDEVLVYVTEERSDLVAKKKTDLDSTYMCDSQLEGEGMAKYREVLDAFNKPQLEALLRMMDEIVRREPAPVTYQPPGSFAPGIYISPPTSPMNAPPNPFGGGGSSFVVPVRSLSLFVATVARYHDLFVLIVLFIRPAISTHDDSGFVKVVHGFLWWRGWVTQHGRLGELRELEASHQR
jgi:hypothetical protein